MLITLAGGCSGTADGLLPDVDAGHDQVHDDAHAPREAGSEGETPTMEAGDIEQEAPAPCRRGLVAWWRADGDGSDSVGADVATLAGGFYGSGVSGSAFVLDGIDDYVSVGPAPLGFARRDFTIALWVSFAALAAETTILDSHSGTYPASKGVALEAYPDAVRFLVRDTTASEHDFNPRVILGTGGFRHLAFVRQGATLRVYVDGLLLGEEARGEAIDVGPGGSAWFGSLAGSSPGGSGRWMSGALDDIRVYDRALSPADVAAMHDAAGICLP